MGKRSATPNDFYVTGCPECFGECHELLFEDLGSEGENVFFECPDCCLSFSVRYDNSGRKSPDLQACTPAGGAGGDDAPGVKSTLGGHVNAPGVSCRAPGQISEGRSRE